MVPVVSHGDRFLKSFCLIVHPARSNGVDVAEVLFGLGVNLRVSVDFAGRSDGNPCALVLCKSQTIVDAQRTHFQGLDGDLEVIDWGGGRREVQNVLELSFDVNVLRDIMLVEREPLVAHQMFQILEVTRNQVVHGLDLESFFDESVTQVRPEESCCTGDENAFHLCLIQGVNRTAADAFVIEIVFLQHIQIV